MMAVEPIRDPQKLAAIKNRLRRENARYYAFFTLGVNTALRPGDLLKLKAKDVYHDESGTVRSHLYVKAEKTGKLHRIKINDAARDALEFLWRREGTFDPDERLFPWTRQHVWRLVNRWCREVGLTEGRFGGHTLRKTWGYMARKYHGVPIEIIQAKLGHSTPAVTRRYVGISDDEIEDVENHVNL